MRAKRTAVLMGGMSSEREVSLETGGAVLAALQESGHNCIGLDWSPGTSLPALLDHANVDVVWNALHGTLGEDGAVQGLLECMGLPYTGSGVLSSATAMDKIASKKVFEMMGIPTPVWQVVARDSSPDQIEFEPPIVIKPANDGSSVGVSIVETTSEIGPALERIRGGRGDVLIERFVSGQEMCTGILGDGVLGSIEIRPAKGFYDYEAKYQRDDTEYLLPPTCSATTLARMEEIGLEAHRVLGCRGYSRVDFRVSEAGEPFVLEINTLPGMTSHSLIPKIAAHAGMSYGQLCERILEQATLDSPLAVAKRH